MLRRVEDFCVGSFGDHGVSSATLEEVLAGDYPGAVLVHGDTSPAMAAALAAFHLRIPVAHVEAGLRTGGTVLMPFPKELNRQLISCIAAFNLAPTWVNAENLIHENIPDKQDVEFSIFGSLFQAGRSARGIAGMGGNGQFNRLTALDALVEGPGPRRDRLTEDQDLGLRLVAAGWKSRQELRATVDQQGLCNLRRLYRQRTRWSQGNLQAMSQLPAVWRADLPFAARGRLVVHVTNIVTGCFAGISLLVT